MKITQLTVGVAPALTPAMRTRQTDQLVADAPYEGDDITPRSTPTRVPDVGAVRRRTALAALPALVLVLVASCSTGHPPADPITASSTSTPMPSPRTTAQDTATMRDSAYDNAKTSYVRWMAMQPNKRADLPQKVHQVATQRAIDDANKTNRVIFQNGITATGYVKVVSMKGVSYEMSPHAKVVLKGCVASTQRFRKDGRDVTVDPHGKPLPKTETRDPVLVTFATADRGTTWKVDTEQQQDKSC